jgi:hypothetical protein
MHAEERHHRISMPLSCPRLGFFSGMKLPATGTYTGHLRARHDYRCTLLVLGRLGSNLFDPGRDLPLVVDPDSRLQLPRSQSGPGRQVQAGRWQLTTLRVVMRHSCKFLRNLPQKSLRESCRWVIDGSAHQFRGRHYGNPRRIVKAMRRPSRPLPGSSGYCRSKSG